MSIEDTDKVDFIGIEVDSDKVILTITDHLDWSNEHGHLLSLQEKMNTYARFIESGELVSTYPNAAGRKPVIDVVTQFEIPKTCVQFLEEARTIIARASIELRTHVLPP